MHVCTHLRDGVFAVQWHIIDKLSWNKHHTDSNVLWPVLCNAVQKQKQHRYAASWH